GLVVTAVLARFGMAAPEGMKVVRDLAYAADDYEPRRADLYIPEKADGPIPVIVWIHGGIWSIGSRMAVPEEELALVHKGYVVASIGYRLSDQAVFPAQIEDCKAAVRWLRSNAKKYQFDSDHIGVWGATAGGHLAALLGTSGGVKELEGEGGNLDQ